MIFQSGGRNSQRGFALLIVTMSISIIAIVIHIFVFKTKKELRATYAVAEREKARYIALSTLEITKLFLKVQAKYIDSNPMMANMGIDMGQILPMIMPMFFGDGAMVNMMIGTEVEGLGLKKGQGTGGIETFKAEDGKINLNCAIGASNITELTTILTALLNDRRYDELFQRNQKDAGTMDRMQQVASIIDYIDIDQSGMGANGGDEDGYYKSLREPYESKNNLLDSTEEIRLIKGIDDIFWTNFGKSFTVYGSCKLNLCSVDPENWQLIAGLIIASSKNPVDPVITDPVKLKKLASTIGPQLIGICQDPNMFAQAVQNPGIAGGVIASSMGVSVDAMTDLGNDGISDSEVQGVELDSSKLQNLIVKAPKRFYRIKGFGVSGKTRSEIEVVWDQMAINQVTGKIGSYVYWKEE